MDAQQNDALIQRSDSSDTMNDRTRNSNAKAFKVAGLTVLACLLLAGQAITAYLVLGQRDHISALEKGQENLKMEFTRRASGAPKIMQVAKNSMPLLKSFTDDDSTPKETVPLSRLQKTSFQREGSGLIYDVPRLEPKRIQLPMSSLPLATEFTDEKTEGDSDEAPMSTVGSKCQLEASGGVKPGVFKPQCDEQGNYLPMQCWHSTGYCWCVDKDGHEIPDTATRGRPKCGGGVYAGFLRGPPCCSSHQLELRNLFMS